MTLLFRGSLDTTLDQWSQFVTETPSQDERCFPVLRKFERQFVGSVIGENGVGLEV